MGEESTAPEPYIPPIARLPENPPDLPTESKATEGTVDVPSEIVADVATTPGSVREPDDTAIATESRKPKAKVQFTNIAPEVIPPGRIDEAGKQAQATGSTEPKQGDGATVATEGGSDDDDADDKYKPFIGSDHEDERDETEGTRSNPESSDDDTDDETRSVGSEESIQLGEAVRGMPSGLMKSLLVAGKLGSKPLHAAAAAGDEAELHRLLAADGEMHGSVDDLDPFDYTALHVACEAGETAAVQCLLAYGADVEAQTKMHMSRPLHYAAFKGFSQVCSVLLKAGCDVNPRTADRRTPLYQAAMRGNADCVNVLLESGANAEVEAKDGKKAVDVAEDDRIRALLEHPQMKKRKVES